MYGLSNSDPARILEFDSSRMLPPFLPYLSSPSRIGIHR